MAAPSILTDEWITACNDALAAIEHAPGARPHLVVTELVRDAPRGTHDAVTLVADDTGVRLAAGRDDAATAWLSLAMQDVEAMHAGTLQPASALTEGRVRVRGDLRAVVDAVGLLAAAHLALAARD